MVAHGNFQTKDAGTKSKTKLLALLTLLRTELLEEIALQLASPKSREEQLVKVEVLSEYVGREGEDALDSLLDRIEEGA